MAEQVSQEIVDLINEINAHLLTLDEKDFKLLAYLSQTWPEMTKKIINEHKIITNREFKEVSNENIQTHIKRDN